VLRLAAGPGDPSQAPPSAITVGQVTVVAWPAQAALAVDLGREAGRSVDWPGLGRSIPGAIRLIIVPDGRRLDSLTNGRAPHWGAAIALPENRTILLRADQGDLIRTLRHELAHLALHEQVPVRVPLWFDEGYAAWAAGEWDRFRALELNVAVARGSIPTFTALDGALRSSASTAEVAYALAVSAVAELARRNPSGTLRPLLARLRGGADFDAAVVASTGLSLDRFEGEWRRVIKRRYSLGAWLVAGGGWGVLALILWGLVRLRHRSDRTRRDALDHGWNVAPEDTNGTELDPTPQRW